MPKQLPGGIGEIGFFECRFRPSQEISKHLYPELINLNMEEAHSHNRVETGISCAMI